MGGRAKKGESSGYARDGGALEHQQKVALRQHRQFLFDADVDGSKSLVFEEFVVALPAHLRSKHSLSELRSWFALVDVDGSGEVTLDEYFRWSLSASSLVTGAGVIHSFEAYDASKNGKLEKHEFLRCAEDAGYGDAALQLWELLPRGSDGTLDYTKLIDSHQQVLVEDTSKGDTSLTTMKNMLCSLAWDDVKLDSLEQGEWTFQAHDHVALRTELTKLLRWHTISLSELFDAMCARKQASKQNSRCPCGALTSSPSHCSPSHC